MYGRGLADAGNHGGLSARRAAGAERGQDPLTYKAGKTTTYWPDALRPERLVRLGDVWRRIVALLETRIAGVADALPAPPLGARGRALKDYEDRLDAVVCAWVAIEALDGRARAYGDADSAIWVPEKR